MLTRVKKFWNTPDYLDDCVRSRTISIAALIAITSPFIQWMYLVLSRVETIAKQPIFYFFFYMLLAFLIYMFMIIPIQIGNKISSTKSQNILLLTCNAVNAYLIWHTDGSEISYDTPSVYQYILILTSSFADTVIITMYISIMLHNQHWRFIAYSDIKYNKLKSIKIINSRNTTNINQDREIEKGYLYLILQFIWPTVDDCDEHEVVVYPARLFYAAYLAFIGVIAVFILYIRLCFFFDEKLKALKQSIDDHTGRQNPIISLSTQLYEFGISFNLGLYIGSICGLLFGLYGIFIMFRAWDKKTINIRRQTPTFRYNESMFPAWYTTKFMASLASYFIAGCALISFLFAIIFGLFSYPVFWEMIADQWQYFAGYFGYLFVEYVFVRYLFHEKMDLLNNYENIFNVVMIISDFMYLPLAIASGVFRILIWICIAVFSYMRPDINIYPRGLEDWDVGHFTFIASVKLLIQRENKYIERYENDQQHNLKLDLVSESKNLNYHSFGVADNISVIEKDAFMNN